MWAKSAHKKKDFYSMYFNQKAWTPDGYCNIIHLFISNFLQRAFCKTTVNLKTRLQEQNPRKILIFLHCRLYLFICRKIKLKIIFFYVIFFLQNQIFFTELIFLSEWNFFNKNYFYRTKRFFYRINFCIEWHFYYRLAFFQRGHKYLFCKKRISFKTKFSSENKYNFCKEIHIFS